MVEPCAIMVASTPITGGTAGSGGTCTPVLDKDDLTINFVAVSDPIDQAMGAIACAARSTSFHKRSAFALEALGSAARSTSTTTT